VLDDPGEAARAAGLRYVSDTQPGIRRRRSGRGFAYFEPDGQPIRGRTALQRIRALAIPPAWSDVWICSDPRGHLQATGRDARGRKQYRYHRCWREVRDETKFGGLIDFGRTLRRLRERVRRDLAREAMPREKVIATVVRLLDSSYIRVGNVQYARENESFGLTTLRDDHVKVRGERIRFRFRGKGGKEHDIDLKDRTLARIVARCQDLPGQELFRYLDEEGRSRTVESADINDYLRESAGNDFTAKDFRTWAGTVLAARELSRLGCVKSEAEAKRNLVTAIHEVALELGNTTAVCRRCYVHPAIVQAYLDGRVIEGCADSGRGCEAAVLELLEAAKTH
jgi:DNA topoisomerase-1